jgi:hypothetical protein
MSVMVWGAISLNKKSRLVVMPVGRRTAVDFVEVVYEGPLIEFLDEFIYPVLMEDGSPLHRSNAPKHWLQEHEVKKMVWPAQSPDMNPIENLWMQMKQRVAKAHTPSMTRETFTKSIMDAWEDISIDRINTLVNSMPSRVSDLMKNKGKSTRW